jgi:hypothetical protein
VIPVDINSDSDIDVRSDRSNRVNLPALPIVHLPAVPAHDGSSGTLSARYCPPGPPTKVVCGYDAANLDRVQANAGMLARAHVATDPDGNSSSGRPWWAGYCEMADWSVPPPALLRDPDTWTYEAFHDGGDIVHLPYDMLGLGESPACFFCNCNLLVRRKDPPDASKVLRTPQGKAMQRRRIFCPPFSKSFTRDLAEKVYPVWMECDECAISSVACAPRGTWWFKSESDRGAGVCQYFDCGQQTFDGHHLCPDHAATTYRTDNLEHRGERGAHSHARHAS